MFYIGLENAIVLSRIALQIMTSIQNVETKDDDKVEASDSSNVYSVSGMSSVSFNSKTLLMPFLLDIVEADWGGESWYMAQIMEVIEPRLSETGTRMYLIKYSDGGEEMCLPLERIRAVPPSNSCEDHDAPDEDVAAEVKKDKIIKNSDSGSQSEGGLVSSLYRIGIGNDNEVSMCIYELLGNLGRLYAELAQSGADPCGLLISEDNEDCDLFCWKFSNQLYEFALSQTYGNFNFFSEINREEMPTPAAPKRQTLNSIAAQYYNCAFEDAMEKGHTKHANVYIGKANKLEMLL